MNLDDFDEVEIPGTDKLIIPISINLKDSLTKLASDQNFKSYLLHEVAKLLAKELVKDVKQEIIHQIEFQVGDIITEALNGEINSTNSFGEVRAGTPKTLREMVIDEAKAWLAKPIGDSYARNRTTHFQKYLADTIDSAFKRELEKELNDAKALAKQNIASTAAIVIAEKIAGR